jgi:hypothetical protein
MRRRCQRPIVLSNPPIRQGVAAVARFIQNKGNLALRNSHGRCGVCA